MNCYFTTILVYSRGASHNFVGRSARGSLEDRKRSAIGSIFVEIDQLAWVGGSCVMIGDALWIVALQEDSCFYVVGRKTFQHVFKLN